MQLKDYIQGNRHGKEANRFEREAMNDPFLQGALDGFDSVAGDHSEIIEELEDKYTHPHSVSKPKNKALFYWIAVASISLLIGSCAYFLLKKNSQSFPSHAEIQPIENRDIIPADSSTSKSEFVDESQPEETTVKKIVHAPAKITTPPVETEKISKSPANSIISLPDQTEVPAIVDRFIKPMPKESDAQTNNAISTNSESEPVQSAFGEKEFQVWCSQKVNKNVCPDQNATVKVSFFINENGKPSKIEYKKFTCEDAKKEIENLLYASPAWTKTNRKVTITIKW